MKNLCRVFLLIILLAAIAGCGKDSPVMPSSGDGDPGLDDLMGRNFPSGMNTDDILPVSLPDNSDLPEYVEDDVLIVLNDGFDPGSVYPLAKKSGLSLMDTAELRWGTVYKMHIDDGRSAEEVVGELKPMAEIKYAALNLIPRLHTVPHFPNDKHFETEDDADDIPWSHRRDAWGPNLMGASACWPETTGEGVVVAVFDTGITYDHIDLVNQVWINEDEIPDNGIDDDENGYPDDIYGWDFMENDGHPWDWYASGGHGTYVAGVIGAEQDNHTGISGLAPGSRMMNIALGGDLFYTMNGMEYAYDNGADILNMSFGFTGTNEILEETIASIWDDGNGMLLVASRGNDYDTDPMYPASLPEVIGVSALTMFGYYFREDIVRADFSSYGSDTELSAPGYYYFSTDRWTYSDFGGT